MDNNYIKPINNNIGAMYQSSSDSEFKSKASNNQNNSDIVIYPNPTKTEINIISNIAIDNMIYKIYNQQGQYLFEGRLLHNNRISVSELANGFYYIEAFDNNGRAFREKFIVKN